MRFISIPVLLVMAFKPYFQNPPKPSGAAPVQICLFQQPTGGVSVGICPPPVIGPVGPQGIQGIQGLVGPQGPPGPSGTGTSNLPPSVAPSTLPQNTLALVMLDGTVIPLSIVNPSPLATAGVARLAVVTPVMGNGGIPMVAPISQTSSEFPGVTYIQANVVGWKGSQ